MEKHEEKYEHITHKRKHKKIGVWQISTAVLMILFLISIFTSGYTEIKSLELTGQVVADKTVKFINENLMQGQAIAKLKGIEESNGMYKIKLDINGQEMESYVSKNGKLLFPQVIDLDQIPKTPQPPQTQDIPKTANPDIKLFTMTFCPYGNQAEEAMHPVVELLKDGVNVEPHYVIYSNYRGGGSEYCLDSEGKYCSMHGIQELNQDVRELCVYKYQKDKYWDFVMKINKECSAQNVDSCWEPIAKEKGIDTKKIKTCQKDEAIELLKKEVKLNKKYGIRGSPTLVINDVTYNGRRTSEAYKQAICSAFTTEPSECSKTLSGNTASLPTGGCG